MLRSPPLLQMLGEQMVIQMMLREEAVILRDFPLPKSKELWYTKFIETEFHSFS